MRLYWDWESRLAAFLRLRYIALWRCLDTNEWIKSSDFQSEERDLGSIEPRHLISFNHPLFALVVAPCANQIQLILPLAHLIERQTFFTWQYDVTKVSPSSFTNSSSSSRYSNACGTDRGRVFVIPTATRSSSVIVLGVTTVNRRLKRDTSTTLDCEGRTSFDSKHSGCEN
jgi:hypothetical protein